MFTQFLSEIGGWWPFIKGLGQIILILLSLYMLAAIIHDHFEQEDEGHLRD